MSKVILYEHIEFGGLAYGIDANTPVIPPPMGSGDGQASSIRIFTNEWVTFWEGKNFDEGNDQLWVAPPGVGYIWELKNLHNLCRPHGNNHWGDRIQGVSFPGTGPTGDLDNILIINSDGTLGGNTHACGRLNAVESSAEKLSMHSQLIRTLDGDASELRLARSVAQNRVCIKGVLTDEGITCPALRTESGELYTLVGDLKGFKVGDTVYVSGTVVEISFCQQGITIAVDWISKDPPKL